MSTKKVKKLMQMTLIIPLLAVMCLSKKAQVDSGKITSSCSAAKIQFEDRCPLTKVELIHQAKPKQCSNVVLPCQEQRFLDYHCLPNTWQNQTISVCALPQIINGFRCAEFNLRGNNIQPLYETNCSHDIPPCPFRYSSLVAYKYKMCYMLRNNKNADGRIQADRKEDGTQKDTILDSFWSNLRFPWPFVLLVLILSAGVGVHCLWRKLIGKQQRSSSNNIITHNRNNMATTAVVTENSSLPDFELKDHLV